ncbi:hypothetical protein RQCS_28280 [Rhodococcus qingshengii]|nr:hypothetical protein RQCS_28280 [Rhodococcus qingshengii]
MTQTRSDELDGLFEDLEVVVKQIKDAGCERYRAFLGLRHVYAKVYRVKYASTESLDETTKFPAYEQSSRK